MDELTALRRRVQTLESRLEDLAERVSAYQSGTDKNPNTGVFVSDGDTGGVAKLDYDSANGNVRVTKVR
jgi:hypothetical protein